MKKTGKLLTVIWICTVCMMFVLLISHVYGDLIITTRHGINFWNILKDGKFLEFYSANQVETGSAVYSGVRGCAYNILVYIVFAIWNFPLYLLEHFGGVDVMNSIPCLVYCKLLLVVCVVITARLLKETLMELEVQETYHSLLVYLYASSSLLVTIIFISGQYDILSLVFQMLGFLAFLRGRDKAFAMWFGIAFCFKYFAAIIFVPLLLLRHKKVASWIRHLLLLMLPFIITNLPFTLYSLISHNAAESGVVGGIYGAKLVLGMIKSSSVNDCANLFVIAYVAILAWCYLQDNTSENLGRYGVWACMLAYAAFFGLMDTFPYWAILMAPFVTLAIALAPQYLHLNLILETVGYAGFTGVKYLRYAWVYFGYTLESTVWPHILAGTRFDPGYSDNLLIDFINGFYSRGEYHAAVNSFFIGAFAALAFTTYPARKPGSPLPEHDAREIKTVLVLRFLINVLICMLPILTIFLKRA